MKNSYWTFCIVTFGCKVNQYESQSIREAWINLHGQEIHIPYLADVVLLNTCAITANAIADVRQMIKKLQKTSPNTKIILTGCAAELPNTHLKITSTVIYISQKNKTQLLHYSPIEKTSSLSPLSNTHAFPSFSITNFTRSRPIIKVQDGCSHACSYCIIPTTRGRPYSRKPKDCLSETRQLLNAGFREIIISGINLRQYKTSSDGCNDFWDLLLFLDRALSPEWKDKARLRISSIDPAQLTERSFEILSKCTMLCPHLHISIQSGSVEILKKMRRNHYTPEDLLTIAKNISNLWPLFGLGADILMGFPGETKTNVQETLDIIDALPLTYAHVFPFSARPNTLAATLPYQIETSERQKRSALVRQRITKKQHVALTHILLQPSLQIAPEGNGKSGGIDEYYTHCTLVTPMNTRELIKTKPISIIKTGLLVEPLHL